MASTPQPIKTPDPIVVELVKISAILDVIADRQQRTEEQQQRVARELLSIRDLLERFTDNGASIAQLRQDPLLVAYAAMLGPIFGDRIDAAVDNKGTGYIDEMTKGAAVLARKLVATLDAYRRESDPRASLEQLVEGNK
jgi:hypothetical protein